MSEPVMISIYLPYGVGLEDWIREFQRLGFEETDWCEMKHPDGEVLTYGPCEPRKG